MANPLFPKFNQAQQAKRKAKNSLELIKTLSTKTKEQDRIRLMNEARSLRQLLKGGDKELDRQLAKLENDAQRNVIAVHAGARQSVEDALAIFTGSGGRSTKRIQETLAKMLTSGVRDMRGTVESSINLIEQLSPQLFGNQNKTPEQAGGVLAEPPKPRRIIPAEPDTWQGMRLIGDNRVEIRTGNFRGRYFIDDPAITGKMVPNAKLNSNVHSIGFQMNLKSPPNSTLFVKYRQKRGHNGQLGSGPTYGYKNVHPRLFNDFLVANSKGTFVWDSLRIRGTVAGAQYEYYLDSISRGYVPRRAVIENGIQILKRRKRTEAKSGRTVVSQLRQQRIGPYSPAKGSPANRGNPDRGSRRPNRGR